MELVENGGPFDAYCRAKSPDVRQRVDLVARVADAVHHAHQKGIIHRDLKPANERRELIESAVVALRRIERDAGDDAELLRTVAEAYRQVGDLNGLDWLASAEEAATGE